MGDKGDAIKPNVEKLKAKRDVAGLIKALDHRHPAVRNTAFLALVEVADVSDVEPLIVALRNPSCFGAAARALGRIGDPRAVGPLVAELGGFFGTEAADALGDIGDPRAVEPLVAALDDNWDLLVSSAASALGKIGDPRAVGPLADAMKEWKPRSSIARDAIAEALEKLGPEAAPAKSAPEYDESVCAYCRRPFPLASPGFSTAADTGLSWRQGCDTCGVPVCFNCSAEEAERRGMRGSCVCPSCGQTLEG